MTKRKLHIIYLLALLITLGTESKAQNMEGYDEMIHELVKDTVPYMDIQELQEKLGTSIYLLDTRETNEYQTSHIPGAMHVGYLFFKMKSMKDIPKDAVIVTYCSVGYRSGKLGERLIRRGYQNVYNLKGGIFSWVNESGVILDSKNDTTSNVHGYDDDWSKWLNENNCTITLD